MGRSIIRNKISFMDINTYGSYLCFGLAYCFYQMNIDLNCKNSLLIAANSVCDNCELGGL